jgi:hypothetical protein
MTRTSDLGESATVSPAQIAYDFGRARLPIWTPLVRAIAGDQKLDVRLTGGPPKTDGATVWLQVTPELAQLTHDHTVCGQWDPVAEQMRCEACQRVMESDNNLFHECSHILNNSFQGGKMFPGVYERLEAWLGKTLQPNPMLPTQLAQFVAASGNDKWAFMAWNVVEDAYVNHRLFVVRRGLRRMFASDEARVMRAGVQTSEGKKYLRDQHEWLQATTAAYLWMSGYENLLDLLQPDLVTQLESEPSFMVLVRDVGSMPQVGNRMERSLDILLKLREMGIEPPLPEKNDESDPGDSGDSDSGGTGDGQPDQAAQDAAGDPQPSDGGDPTDGTPDDAQGVTGGEPDGSDPDDPDASSGGPSNSDESDESNDGEPKEDSSDGEPSEDNTPGGNGLQASNDSMEVHLSETLAEEMLAALTGHDSFGKYGRQVMDFDKSSGPPSRYDEVSHIGSLDGWIEGNPQSISQLTMEPKGYVRSLKTKVSDYQTPTEFMIPATQRARLAFTANRASGMVRNLTSGRRIDSKTMGYRIPTDDERLFSRRTIPRRRDWTVLIGIDISGSTARGPLENEKVMVFGVGQLLSNLGIPFSIWAHTGTSGDLDGYYELIVLPVKQERDTWMEAQPKLAGLMSGAYNLDGHTLQVYRKLMQRQRGTDKLLLYFTDGAMPAENRDVETPVLKGEIRKCQMLDIHLVGVGVGTDSPRQHGLDTIRVDDIGDLPMFVKELSLRLTRGDQRR